MAPHHAFDVIFGVWMTYGRVRASTLQPLAGDALTSTAEFVAHVLLDRDGPEPTRSPSTEELRSGANPYQLGEMVAEIVSFLPVLFTTRQLGHDGDLDPLRLQRLGGSSTCSSTPSDRSPTKSRRPKV